MKKNALPPEIYSYEYYTKDCGGYEDYLESGGYKIQGRLALCLKIGGVKKGMKVLDIGCGRGELVLHSAIRGAEVRGIDYSEVALELAARIIPDEYKWAVSFGLADVKSLNEPENFYDLIFLTDVVEHLYDWELDLMFVAVRKMLKTGGRVVIHTAPNRLLYDVAYPLVKFLARFKGTMMPRPIRTPYEKLMHVNEQTMGKLRKLLARHKFSMICSYFDFDFIASITGGNNFFRKLSNVKRLEGFFARSLLVVAYKDDLSLMMDKQRLYNLDIDNDIIFDKGFYANEAAGRWSSTKSQLTFFGESEEVVLAFDFPRPHIFFPDVLHIKCGSFYKKVEIIESDVLSLSVPIKKNELNTIYLQSGYFFSSESDNRELSFRLLSPRGESVHF